MKKIAISLGDINGVGVEIALKAHEEIKKICEPIYHINQDLLNQASKLLSMPIPSDFNIASCGKNFKIKPSKLSKKSGKFSYISFVKALKSVDKDIVSGVVTLPINKKAWQKAGIDFLGHTEVLRKRYKKKAIMMLGCEELFVGLYSDHVGLKEVPKLIKTKKIYNFLLNFYTSTKFENVAVMGLNPHAGDNGVFGNEENKIKKAIKLANKKLKKEIFIGPVVPDASFNKNSLKKHNRIIAMYHDQGLIPLKALYFEKSINVSLNLPIIRASVDHGTAFDIAYKGIADTSSYIEAVKFVINQK